MPAVTADTQTLPRLPKIDPATPRPVRHMTQAPKGFEGEGFPVRRAFAGVSLTDLDPFVHMDQMGEVNYAPGEPKGTPWHPHRGFETVTYMIDGTFQHQDSNGGGGLIENGATQWMTAGSGILHIETPPEDLVVSGGLFHGVQLWVNLPGKDKWVPPAYQALEADDVKLVTSPDATSLVRIVAGDVGGQVGPGGTHTPMAYVHATVPAGERLEIPWDPDFNALVYTLAGTGTVGPDAHPIQTGTLAVMGRGSSVTVTAASRPVRSDEAQLDVLILGGQPIREHVEMYGPFVMNTRAELGQAIEDFEAGRLGQIPPNALMPHVPDPAPVRTERTGI
jgi:redox-sensitive bicupin YhaK (pirin superfamily)